MSVNVYVHLDIYNITHPPDKSNAGARKLPNPPRGVLVFLHRKGSAEQSLYKRASIR